jgi:PEP-CTERM motif
MRTMTKLLLSLATPAVMLAAQSANAVLITDWKYENIPAFTAFAGIGTITGSNISTAAYTIGGSPANPVAGAATKLSWGNPQTSFGQSSFRLGAQKYSGTETVNDGVFSPDLDLFHDNFVIDLGTTLRTATLTSVLLLEALNPATGDVIGPVPGVFQIKFQETDNSLNPCPAGGPNPCADIFVLDEAASSPLSFDFIVQDYTYTLTVDLPNLQNLSASACAAAGAAAGCRGFSTPENQTSVFPVRFDITARQNTVPEPGMLALLGLGLAGIGFGQIRRRK